MNIHKLKDKKKNINRQLSYFYKKRQDLNVLINDLEEARFNTKSLLDKLHNKEKIKK